MRCYLSSIATLVGIVFICAQTPIVLEAGPISHTDLDGYIDESYPISIEDCSSIIYEVDYNFSLPWVAIDNMDHNLECLAPPCPGDPSDPQAAGCDDCWDFMWIESVLDGTTVDDITIGADGNLDQSGTYTFGPICTDGATIASIDIRNQNNQIEEINTYSNVTIVCWEAAPEVTTIAPICDGENLNLVGQVENNNDVDSWMWSNDGAGVIDNDSSPNTFATNSNDGETYTLTTTDTSSEACTASANVMVSTIASFTATVMGDADLCPGACTDITIQITGGVAPYEIVFSFSGFPITIPGIDVDEVFSICYDENITFPDLDDSTTPITITLPPLPININVSEISDANCTITNVGSVAITPLPGPDATNPG